MVSERAAARQIDAEALQIIRDGALDESLKEEQKPGGTGQRKSLATTYSPTPRGSTIGPGGLNFRVRNGNGWAPAGMVTRLKQ